MDADHNAPLMSAPKVSRYVASAPSRIMGEPLAMWADNGFGAGDDAMMIVAESFVCIQEMRR